MSEELFFWSHFFWRKRLLCFKLTSYGDMELLFRRNYICGHRQVLAPGKLGILFDNENKVHTLYPRHSRLHKQNLKRITLRSNLQRLLFENLWVSEIFRLCIPQPYGGWIFLHWSVSMRTGMHFMTSITNTVKSVPDNKRNSPHLFFSALKELLPQSSPKSCTSQYLLICVYWSFTTTNHCANRFVPVSRLKLSNWCKSCNKRMLLVKRVFDGEAHNCSKALIYKLLGTIITWTSVLFKKKVTRESSWTELLLK